MVTKRLILSKTFTVGNWKYREDTLPDGSKLTYFNGAVSKSKKSPVELLIDEIEARETISNIIPSFLIPHIKGGC